MKKLILLLVMVMGISIGCERSLSVSSKPTFFVIQTIRQDNWDKKTNVAQYKLECYTSTGMQKTHWFTLQEGFQVGDTLKFTKI
jgi:hypothetical protein